METCKSVSKIEKMLPKISVIVPAYNIEQYLPRCLDSILAQSYCSIEIIVINDGSSDHTGDIADLYAAENCGSVKVIHLDNRGVTRARLAGVGEASGEWIGFVDGDDEIETDMYERLIANAVQYKADISHCGYQTIVNNGERIHYFYNTGRLVVRENEEGLRDLIEGKFTEPSLCNKIFRKSLFERWGFIIDKYQEIRINEDLLMNYFLFKEASVVVFEDFCPYHYMTRSTSVTRVRFSENKVLDPVRVRRIIFEDVSVKLQDSALLQYLRACLGAYAYLTQQKRKSDFEFEIYQILIDYKDKISLLNRRERIKYQLLITSPKMYGYVFRLYEKYFQRKTYE